jgi:hypothetical protein
MEERGVVALGRVELPGLRHLDVVQSGRVVRPVAAVLDLGPTDVARDDLLAGLDGIPLGDLLGCRSLDAVDLVEVEDREVAQEQEAPVLGLAVLVLGGLPHRLPEHDLRALLALADGAAALLRLLERQPVRAGVALQLLLDGQDPDVDAAVLLVTRERRRSLSLQGLPGPVPGNDSLLQRLDDPARDDLVGICLRGHSDSSCVG